MECDNSLNIDDQTRITNYIINKINVANILEKLSPKLKTSFNDKFKDPKIKPDNNYYFHDKCIILNVT